ncbi:dCTP deaminase [Helicobacter himalayensis]|uniref:dCTP deaminase n=1 Tax=Helicobacter himalayensis TaxID=1591088 RepID=UPI00082E9E6C|nr:dCTP deaminase [Helicobacter himalayensis]
MGLKADSWIREMSLKHKMIEPFCEKQVGKNTISYGLSSYGYDIRVGEEFMIFSNIGAALVDPKNFKEENVVVKNVKNGQFCIIPPNSFALAHSIEYFRMPRDVLAVCLGKSTYARCGIIVNVTPFEPEFEGHITIEISNTTPLPAKIYANEGIAQVLFLQGDDVCEVSYKDRGGKYQGQRGITLPRILES